MTNNITIEFSKPNWLTASGDSRRLEVKRSLIVKESSDLYAPVSWFIKGHGLVLESSENVADADWMRGEYELSVYVTSS